MQRWAFFLLWLVAASAAVADERRGQVLFLRHALAPGAGDPPEMRLDDCTTQRNLSAEGRDQARALGRRLRAAGIGAARVWTSQWCRCRETAVLLGFGEPVEMTALNSFFQDRTHEQDYREALAVFLEELSPDGPPVILVTHYVTIQAMTGQRPASGAGVWMRRSAVGGWEPAGKVAAP